MKSARPVAEPNPGFWTQLQKYEEALQSLPRLSMEPAGPCSGTGGDELQNEP